MTPISSGAFLAYKTPFSTKETWAKEKGHIMMREHKTNNSSVNYAAGGLDGERPPSVDVRRG